MVALALTTKAFGEGVASVVVVGMLGAVPMLRVSGPAVRVSAPTTSMLTFSVSVPAALTVRALKVAPVLSLIHI